MFEALLCYGSIVCYISIYSQKQKVLRLGFFLGTLQLVLMADSANSYAQSYLAVIYFGHCIYCQMRLTLGPILLMDKTKLKSLCS